MGNLEYKKFNNINLNDPFFDSLKLDYKGFSDWFIRKSNEFAYVLYSGHHIDGFLYLKEENEISDINPPIYNKKILKVGTFKFNPKKTLRGQRFVKKILDIAVTDNFDLVYLTVFEKHNQLIDLFKYYGFDCIGEKCTTDGTEFVYARDMRKIKKNIHLDYPFIHYHKNKYLLAIKPEYHTVMFPQSILFGESPDIIQDVSHSNSIHKIYISAAPNANQLNAGDILVIYRTSDEPNRAYFRSVVSSVCVVESVRHINEFKTLDEYLDYCLKFSIFTKEELSRFYYKKYYKYIIRFTYNLSLPKRLNRRTLLDNGVIQDQNRIVLQSISDKQFDKIIELSKANESFIID